MSSTPNEGAARSIVLGSTTDTLGALIADALDWWRTFPTSTPKPGDLVIEPAMIRRDHDAIGWLIEHGQAAYAADGSGPTREVWDVHALSGAKRPRGHRWENAEFYALPQLFAERARRLEKPCAWCGWVSVPAVTIIPPRSAPPAYYCSLACENTADD